MNFLMKKAVDICYKNMVSHVFLILHQLCLFSSYIMAEIDGEEEVEDLSEGNYAPL